MSDAERTRDDLDGRVDDKSADSDDAFVRDDPSIPAFWRIDSSPFSRTATPSQPARVVLRQVDDKNFDVVEPLVYTPPHDVPGAPSTPLEIHPGWLRSDLASIPDVVGWFARRHGRHTPAALVHDLLIVERRPLAPDEPAGPDERYPPGFPEAWKVAPEMADLLFRRMLLDSGVPPVRAYLMWAAVTLRTRMKTGRRRLASVVAWLALALAGTVLLVASVAQGWWAATVVALVAPVPAAALWGRQFRAGVIAGYAVWWALLGAVPAWVAFKLYQVIELLPWALLMRRHRLSGAPPSEAPPAPTSYESR